MTIPDWFGYRALKAILWLNPLVHVAGLAISVWAWRATRKTGYIVVALYFVLALLGKSFPAVLRVVTGQPKGQAALTPQQQQEYTREMMALDKKYFPAGHPVAQTVVFPLGPIVLVAGLWVLAKHDTKKQAQQTTSEVGTPSGQPV
jgi:hypothetical protein